MQIKAIQRTKEQDNTLVLRRWLFLFIAILVIIVDQLTKLWIRINIPLGSSLKEICRVTITNISNTGSAFGLFQGQTIFLSIVALAGLVIIILFYREIGKTSILAGISLGLVFGGACGNLIDRLRLGYITDFIYIRLWNNFYWPAFNVADSAITVGIILLVLFIFFGIRRKDEPKNTSRN